MRSVQRWVGVLGIMASAACYRAVPIETSNPPVGETISFLISDRGRVGLGGRLGRSVARVDGRVVEVASDGYVINVFRVAGIDGQTNTWSGETVRLEREFVERLQGRELNKGKTWLLAAGVTVVVYFIASRGLGGLFDDEREPGDGEPIDEKRARQGIRY